MIALLSRNAEKQVSISSAGLCRLSRRPHGRHQRLHHSGRPNPKVGVMLFCRRRHTVYYAENLMSVTPKPTWGLGAGAAAPGS